MSALNERATASAPEVLADGDVREVVIGGVRCRGYVRERWRPRWHADDLRRRVAYTGTRGNFHSLLRRVGDVVTERYPGMPLASDGPLVERFASTDCVRDAIDRLDASERLDDTTLNAMEAEAARALREGAPRSVNTLVPEGTEFDFSQAAPVAQSTVAANDTTGETVSETLSVDIANNPARDDRPGQDDPETAPEAFSGLTFQGKRLRVGSINGVRYCVARDLGALADYADPNDFTRSVQGEWAGEFDAGSVRVLQRAEFSAFFNDCGAAPQSYEKRGGAQFLVVMTQAAAMLALVLGRTAKCREIRRWLVSVWGEIARTGTYTRPGLRPPAQNQVVVESEGAAPLVVSTCVTVSHFTGVLSAEHRCWLWSLRGLRKALKYKTPMNSWPNDLRLDEDIFILGTDSLNRLVADLLASGRPDGAALARELEGLPREPFLTATGVLVYLGAVRKCLRGDHMEHFRNDILPALAAAARGQSGLLAEAASKLPTPVPAAAPALPAKPERAAPPTRAAVQTEPAAMAPPARLTPRTTAPTPLWQCCPVCNGEGVRPRATGPCPACKGACVLVAPSQ